MVTGLEITKRDVVLGGKAFADAGPYEKIAGTIRFTADPEHARNREITDIAVAEKNSQGLVEFSGDFYLLKPVDASNGNKRLLLDVANRGRKVALGVFNSTPRVPDPSTQQDFGNGFLMRHGYTVAWVGWQVDVPREGGLMALDVPRAKGVTGFVRVELRPHTAAATLPLADRGHTPQPTIDLSDSSARMFMREHVAATPVEVPRTSWCFADALNVALEGGFTAGAIYHVVYRSANPTVVGLGFLAVGDTASWLRWGSTESGNPCAGEIERTYVFGQSQSGRFLRQMLYLGLDEDEQGRMVFDGVMPHIGGARRGEFNLRFGQPSLNATRSVGSLPPFNDEGLYERLRERGRVPKVSTTNSAAEYWRGDASLIHTDLEGTRDAEPAEFARTYLFAGTQHTSGPIPPLPADPNTGDRGHHRLNIVDYAPLLRSALVNLDRWVSEGVEPPASAFPRLADGTAVEAEPLGAFFRKIPGVRFPDRIERPLRLDFGAEVERGIASYPPKRGEPYRSYVSKIDDDGNEVSGIRPPELGAPLATFCGWNPRHAEQGAPGDLMSMMGSTLPFARTREERGRTGDPRLSVAERYPSKAAYLERVRESTRKLIAARHVLSEDLEAIVDRASQRWDWAQGFKEVGLQTGEEA